MQKDIFKACAVACKEVYEENVDIGTTEFFIKTIEIDGITYQILSIAGTNEKKDWFKNFDLFSKKGIKKSSLEAAKEIMSSRYFHEKRAGFVPLIVTGHSKGGSTAIAFHRLYQNRMIGSSFCVAFAPSRCLRYWAKRDMNRTYVFIDPDDPVSFVGRIGFGLPKCKYYYADNNHFGFKLKDHHIDNWIVFCEKMETDGKDTLGFLINGMPVANDCMNDKKKG